jgi:hypothetical protein
VTRGLAVDVDGLDRDAAREAARAELSRPEYAEAEGNPLLRLVGRLVRELLELVGRAAGEVPGGTAGLLVVAALLVGLTAVALARLRPTARVPRDAVFAGGRVLTADEHRALAEAAAAAGRYDDAVRERLRALVRELESRGVLDARAGRTAGEVAREAGSALPELAAGLGRAATVFGEVAYGGKAADASSYAELVAVDDAVRRARLVVA